MKTHTEAIEEFNRHEHRGDGAQVAGSLAGGLTVIRDSLYARMHDDVERKLGMDSMLRPISDNKAERLTKAEIELYQIAESAVAARQHGYVRTDDDWYLQWLTRLRLGPGRADERVVNRLTRYCSKTPDDRRLVFTNILAKALPESNRAPLILFRLVPLSVRLATALAFGDHRSAADVRSRPVACLPAIADCQECHGGLLENGEQCRGCGNPLWKFDWLIATD